MFGRFEDHGVALKSAKAFSDNYDVPVWILSVLLASGKSLTLVFGPSCLHMVSMIPRGLIGSLSKYSPSFGWWFGGCGISQKDCPADLLTCPNLPPLPGKQECNYSLAASCTQGFTHDQLYQIAQNMEKYNSCVWHESARLFNRLDQCPCGMCKKK